MNERWIESRFVRYAKASGVIPYKFVSPNRRNVPDRLVACPGGFAFFIEFKAPGKKPTRGQLREHKRLRDLGFEVYVIDQPGEAEKLLDEVLHNA